MRLLGFEIKRSAAAKFSQVTGAPTKPSVPLRQAKPRTEYGDSGTRMASGIINEEYNTNLSGITGIQVYDEMRRSDATVRAAMLAVTLPIRGATWFVKAAKDNDAEAEKQADFVQRALFDWVDLAWDDIVRQALLCIPFGVMVFEKVYGIKNHEGKDYVTLQKLAPRLPRSIQQWELTDGTFGIQQNRQDGQVAQIPGSKLLIFCNEREGDNHWGTSFLRAAYKHWYYKNNFYKIEAVSYERQGMGIPVMKMPMNYTQSEETAAVKVLQNLRANESAFALVPHEYELEFLDMKASGVRDPEKAIAHHNKEILQAVLAQFLELGSTKTGSGSHALSADHSELFLKALEAVANLIVSEINKNLIPELVEMNFNGVTEFPKLAYSGISRVDMAALSEAYAKLTTAGGISASPEDEQYLRSALGLPAMVISEEADSEDDAAAAPQKPASPEPKPTEDPADTKTVDSKAAEAGKNKPQSVDKSTPAKKKASFAETPTFKSWRPLTFTEGKVSWEKIQETMDALEAGLSTEALALLAETKAEFITKLQAAVDSGDIKAINALTIKMNSKYKTLLKDAMKKAYEYGKNNVSTEIGVAAPANVLASIQQIDMVAETVADKTAAELEAKAKLAAANALRQGKSALQAAAAIDIALNAAIEKSVGGAVGTLVGQMLNTGRNDVLAKNTDKLHGIQRSEILDAETCPFCLSVDGIVVAPTDPWAKTEIFHTNCRGIWVGILKDESNPPEVTGVPENIAKYFGGQVNELVQPKKAITTPGSPADIQAQKENK